VPTDLIRLLKIIRKSGYSGYLPIETLSLRGTPPYTMVPEFLKKLRDAIAQTNLKQMWGRIVSCAPVCYRRSPVCFAAVQAGYKPAAGCKPAPQAHRNRLPSS
jgi:hypothetical protein